MPSTQIALLSLQWATSSVTNGRSDRLFQFRGEGFSFESHRWDPHADVAELVDALVSGSSVTTFH
jgi:hypothetical protein